MGSATDGDEDTATENNELDDQLEQLIEKKVEERLQRHLQQQEDDASEDRTDTDDNTVTRRKFLKTLGAGAAGLGVMGMASGFQIRSPTDFSYHNNGNNRFNVDTQGNVTANALTVNNTVSANALNGSLTSNTQLTSIAGNNLSIDSNGALGAPRIDTLDGRVTDLESRVSDLEDHHSCNYDTITVASGNTFTKNISDGEVWENKLIDISADNAAFFIDTRGSSNWTIRNIGVKGQFPDRDDGSVQALWVENRNSSGTSTIENVYLGDGGSGNIYSDSDSSKATGIYVNHDHAGHLDIKNVYVAGWPDNGIYGSAPGNPDSHNFPGAGGTVTIDTAYAANCDVSGFRLGSTGSKFINCVANGNFYRGFWVYYETIDMENCDAYHNDKLNVLINDGATLNVTNSRTSGSPSFGDVKVNGTLNGSFDSGARSTPPTGVPTGAEEAACGS